MVQVRGGFPHDAGHFRANFDRHRAALADVGAISTYRRRTLPSLGLGIRNLRHLTSGLTTWDRKHTSGHQSRSKSRQRNANAWNAHKRAIVPTRPLTMVTKVCPSQDIGTLTHRMRVNGRWLDPPKVTGDWRHPFCENAPGAHTCRCLCRRAQFVGRPLRRWAIIMAFRGLCSLGALALFRPAAAFGRRRPKAVNARVTLTELTPKSPMLAECRPGMCNGWPNA